jgi:hypothetical protein
MLTVLISQLEPQVLLAGCLKRIGGGSSGGASAKQLDKLNIHIASRPGSVTILQSGLSKKHIIKLCIKEGVHWISAEQQKEAKIFRTVKESGIELDAFQAINSSFESTSDLCNPNEEATSSECPENT